MRRRRRRWPASRASRAEIARQAGDPALLQTTAQLDTGSAGDEELDHGELRREVLVLVRSVVDIEGDGDVVALGVKEELRELRCVRITLGEQDQKLRL